MRKNLIETTEDGREMTIDSLCIIQGIEYNQPNTKVIAVYSCEEESVYDAIVLLKDNEYEIKNIKVDNTYILFNTDIFDEK